LGGTNINLLQIIASNTEARNRAGLAGEQDVLKARNDLDMANNDLANLRAQLLIQQAVLNALLNRPPTAAIPLPDSLPADRPIEASDQDLLDRAAKMNPELIAEADEIRAKEQNLHLAKLQYYPDFSLSASTDLQGMAQSLLGQFTVPIIRYEALHAAVAQAQANLRAVEAQRRQAGNDLAAELIDDIATLHDAERQIELIGQTILPRARQAVALTRAAYETGGASFLDLLDSQRSLIDLERLAANLRIIRDKRAIEIEAIDASTLR
jgi:cobalt-zinc-cadmium efflux system outer membrane protein